MRTLVTAMVLSLLLLPALTMAQTAGASHFTTQGSAPPAGSNSQPPPPPRPPRGMGPGGAWWKNSEVVKKLALSDAQVGEIEKTFLEQRLKLVDLRATLDKEELKLQPLLNADRPDDVKVATQLDRIIAARGKLDKANALMLLALRKVLTVQQWHTLQTLQQERETERGRPREETPGTRDNPPSRGGPGNPPPAQ